MNIELNSRLISRNDTTANWNANKTTVLLKGEIGIEFLTDGSLKIKIGDGTTDWENLNYFNDAIKISGDGKSIVVSTVGEVSLFGFVDAETGAQPRKKADGTIEWIKPDTTTVEGLQTAISGLQSDVSGLSSAIDTLNSDIYTTQTMVSNKADASSVYTKDEVDGKLGGVFHYEGNYDSFAALLSDVTSGTIAPAKGDVWNILSAGGKDFNNVDIKAGDNVAYNGTGWDVLSGTVDLSGYVQKVDGSRLITSDEASKLANIEENAEANLLDGVQINGTDLEISNKKVSIPLAGAALGVVLSSDDENEVKVLSTGKMHLNNVNVNKLTISNGDTLILNGGSAS